MGKIENETGAAGDAEEDEEEGEAPGAAGKKKKNKKKPTAIDAGALSPEPQGTAAAPAQEDQDEGNSEEEEEAEAGEGAAAAGAKKKKKKKKKKPAKGEAEAEEDGVEAAPAQDEDEEGEDGEDGEDAAAGKKKRKKRGGKKKGSLAGAGSATGVDGVATYGVADEDFASWAKAALEATRNDADGKSPEELKKPPKEFWGYSYSGSLRPAFVAKQMRMPEGFLLPDYALDKDGRSVSEQAGQKEVPVLEGERLQTMREACRLGREVLDVAARFMRQGITGDEIDRVVYQACVDRKIYPSPLNYYRFPKSVCVSANEVICHGIPDCRPIEEGDIVNLDVSIYYKGFHSDLNETFFIGACDEDAQRLIRTAYSALFAAAALIRPGTFYRDLGSAISTEASKTGSVVVTTYCGHGVGELFHGPPKVPHYRKNKAVGIMKPGHVFTVEPMINLGSNGGDRTWPDNWTAVTRDGKRSAQFEHTFLVTETGVEVLTARVGTDPTCMPAYNPAMFQR